MSSKKLILHLCADIGSDSQPYRDNPSEYEVICVGKNPGVENYTPPAGVYGVIANPPCTMFSIARTRAKTPRDLQEGMRLVKECLRIIWECNYKLKEKSLTMPLKFWVIENPGRMAFLKWFLGKPAYSYCPSEFGYDYKKPTSLWGIFNSPIKPFFAEHQSPMAANEKFKLHEFGRDRDLLMAARSTCPPKFARAFYEANR